jgi:hypothetical protein
VEGHQLVLTYNLFLNVRVGEVLRDNPTADPTQFPLYAGVKEMLEHPGFMKKGSFQYTLDMIQIFTSVNTGGTLGFYCQYPYPHTTPSSIKQLPHSLQGVDMVLWTVFQSLGLKTELLPLLDQSPLDEMDEMEYEREAECYEDDPWSYPQYLDYDEDDSPFMCDCCHPDFPSFEEWKARRPHVDWIGTRFHGLKFTATGEDEDYIREMKEEVNSAPRLSLLMASR